MLNTCYWFFSCCPAPAGKAMGTREFPIELNHRPIMEEPRSEPPASIPVRDQAGPVLGLAGADDRASLAALPPGRKSSFRSRTREPITAENFREQVNETMALAEALSRVKSKRRAPNGYFSPAVDKFAVGADIVKDNASSTSSSTTDLGHIARHFMTSDAKEMADTTDGIRDSIVTFDEDEEVTLATATQVRAGDLTPRDHIATSSPPASDDSFEDVFVLTDSQENSDEDEEDENRGRSMVVEPSSDATCEHKEGNGWSASSDAFEDDSDRSSSGNSNSSFKTVDITAPTEPGLGIPNVDN